MCGCSLHRGPCSDAPLSSRLMSPPTDTNHHPRAPRSSLWSLWPPQGQFGLEGVHNASEPGGD